jgi:transposase
MEHAAPTSLPDDPQLLKSMLIQKDRHIFMLTQERDGLMQQRDSAMHERDQANQQRDRWKLKHDEKEIDRLRLEVELLRYKKWYYGRRADELGSTGEVAQMLLGFAQQLEARPVEPQDLEALPASQPPAEAAAVRRIRRGRRNLAGFDQLPATRKEYDLPQDQKPCPCCGEMRQKIGEESSWQIEYIPGRFERIEHVRFKYACRQCEQNAVNPQITLAEKPSQPIDKGMAGPGLLAYIVTGKYADYLPLYRLESIFERNGLEIDRGTQSLWCRDVAQIVKPLYDLMVQRLLQSHLICTMTQ